MLKPKWIRKVVKKKKAGGEDTEVAADADGGGEMSADGVDTKNQAEPKKGKCKEAEDKLQSEEVDDLDKMVVRKKRCTRDSR